MDQHFDLTIDAPRERVFTALTDGQAIARWMVPDDMTSQVHAFDGRVGGTFRITLTYDEPTRTGKTDANADSFEGRFVALEPPARVVWAVAFESPDPSLTQEMLISFDLSEADGRTHLHATHANLPPTVSAADNELGWQISLRKLKALAEAG